MEEFQLANGIKILCYPIQNAYSIALSLNIRGGLRYENNSNNGISYLLEKMHLKRLGAMDQDEIFYRMESMGSFLRADTLKDTLRYSMRFRPCYFEQSLKIFAELLNAYSWNKEDITATKKTVINEIAKSDTYINIESIMEQVLWKNNPLGFPIIGIKDAVDSITLDDVIAYKKAVFNDNNIMLVITGAITENHIAVLKKCFENIKLPAQLNMQHVVKPVQFNRKPDILLQNKPWEYVDVAMMFDVDSKQITIEDLDMLCNIIGGGDGSILSLALREKMGITYSVSALFEIYNDAACIYIKFVAHKKDIYLAINTITESLRSMKSHIEQCHLDTTKPFLTDNLWFDLEDPWEWNMYLSWRVFSLGQPPFSIEESIERFDKIDAARLSEVVKTIFKPENASAALLGSLNGITQKEIRRIINEGLAEFR